MGLSLRKAVWDSLDALEDDNRMDRKITYFH